VYQSWCGQRRSGQGDRREQRDNSFSSQDGIPLVLQKCFKPPLW
jgi:hypothetical protein